MADDIATLPDAVDAEDSTKQKPWEQFAQKKPWDLYSKAPAETKSATATPPPRFDTAQMSAYTPTLRQRASDAFHALRTSQPVETLLGRTDAEKAAVPALQSAPTTSDAGAMGLFTNKKQIIPRVDQPKTVMQGVQNLASEIADSIASPGGIALMAATGGGSAVATAEEQFAAKMAPVAKKLMDLGFRAQGVKMVVDAVRQNINNPNMTPGQLVENIGQALIGTGMAGRAFKGKIKPTTESESQNASKIASGEGVDLREQGAGVGTQAPLRQPGQAAEARSPEISPGATEQRPLEVAQEPGGLMVPVLEDLPPPEKGTVRLFSGGNSSFATTDPARAASYGDVRFVDVPETAAKVAREAALKSGAGTPGDHLLPNEWVKKQQPVAVPNPETPDLTQETPPAPPAPPAQAQAIPESPPITGKVTAENIDSLSPEQQGILKHGDGIEYGLTLSRKEAGKSGELQKKYDAAAEEMKQAAQKGDNAGMKAAFGKLNFFGGALMGASRGAHPISGSNYTRFIEQHPELAPKPPKSVAPSTTPSENAPTGAGQPAQLAGERIPAPGVAKEAWQMTKAEYIDSQSKTSAETRAIAKDYHWNVINEALQDGKPVPPEVLKDYPDLKPSSQLPPSKPTDAAQQPPSPSSKSEAKVGDNIEDIKNSIGVTMSLGAIRPDGTGRTSFILKNGQRVHVENGRIVKVEAPAPSRSVVKPKTPSVTPSETAPTGAGQPAQLAGEQIPAPGVAKEPWQMTKAEYHAQFPRTDAAKVQTESELNATVKEEAKALDQSGDITIEKTKGGQNFRAKTDAGRKWIADAQRRSFDRLTNAAMSAGIRMNNAATIEGEAASHKIAIQEAIRAGETIPPEVLKDYPDLVQPKPPEAGPGTGAGPGSPHVTEMANHPETGTTGAGQDIYGIAARVRKARADRGQVAPVPSGQGIGAEDAVKWGQELIAAGVDSEKSMQDFERNRATSFDLFAMARGHGEALAKSARGLESQFGTDSIQYRTAQKALSDWDARSKAMQTEWHKQGMAQQGETDIDTGSFTGINRAFREISGRDLNPAEAKTARKLAADVNEADKATEPAKAGLQTAIDGIAEKGTPVKVAADLESQRKAFGDYESGKPMTPLQVKTLWTRAKTEYIDKGNDSRPDIVHKLAIDLGLPVKDIMRGLEQTKPVRRAADDVWQRQRQARMLKEFAKNWVNHATETWLQKSLPTVARTLFTLKTGLHGTVALGTHAPLVVATHPILFKNNFGRMYHLVLSPEYYEMQQHEIARRPNYTVAQRAGLVNDMSKMEDFSDPKLAQGFPKMAAWFKAKLDKAHLGRVVGMGTRGYSVLKILRQDLFDNAWNKLAESEKSPELAKAIADSVNHITGVTKTGGGVVGKYAHYALFAPKLEASRVAVIATDPVRAVNSLLKMKNMTEAEKWFATNQFKEKASIFAVFTGLMLANQQLNELFGDKKKLNGVPVALGGGGWNPMQSDFGKFRVAGMTFAWGSPFLTMTRLPLRIYQIGAGSGGKTKYLIYPDESMYKTGGSYLRTQASPFISPVISVITKGDYADRPLPQMPGYGKPQPVPKRLAAEGVKPYTWKEFGTGIVLPIPFEEGANEVFHYYDLGQTKAAQNTLLRAFAITLIMAGTGGRMAEDWNKPKPRAANPAWSPPP